MQPKLPGAWLFCLERGAKEGRAANSNACRYSHPTLRDRHMSLMLLMLQQCFLLELTVGVVELAIKRPQSEPEMMTLAKGRGGGIDVRLARAPVLWVPADIFRESLCRWAVCAAAGARTWRVAPPR